MNLHASRPLGSLAMAALLLVVSARASSAGAQVSTRTYVLEEVEIKPALTSTAEFQRAIAEGYPEELKRRRLGGVVELRFIIDSSGRVDPESVEVVDATQAAFGEAAKRAVMSAGFRAGRMLGSPVRTRVTMPIVYRL
jgi:periplasmic protein TonB